jgi:hypothetical protein
VEQSETGQQDLANRRRRRRQRQRGEFVPETPRNDRPHPDGGWQNRDRRDAGRRDDRFRRPDEGFEREPNFNRKGVAPEPAAPSPLKSSGMFVGEHRDRWTLVDRRGRPVKRPWLSEDDRNQRLFGNQLRPDKPRGRDDDRRRRFGDGGGSSGRRNGVYGPEQGRKQPPWRRNDDAAYGDEGGSGRRRARRHGRSHSSGAEGGGE